MGTSLHYTESVQSLALPGGYSEKITHLGRSLIGFTNLKHVDLSRNALESLQVSKQYYVFLWPVIYME